MKFNTSPFSIDKKYAASLQKKMTIFRQETATRKALLLTFVTTYGVMKNTYKAQIGDGEITMDALFQ